MHQYTALKDCPTLSRASLQVSLAPKSVAAGGETNEEKISKQADLLADQVPKAFKMKVVLQ